MIFFQEEIFYTKKTDKDKKKLICSLIVAVAGLIALVAILYGSTTTNKELNIDDIFERVRKSFKDKDNLYLLVSNKENGTNDD